MASSLLGSRRRDDPELSLKDWTLKARISCENSCSRRFSGSHVPSFREDPRPSFRTNITISSTASSPGYTIKEEINPSTYSFTTALKALQAKTMYSWEYMSPDGLALNSKWDEAEKYICNPLSGEVPLECLSSKALGATRSFRNLTSRITMSAPLIYPSNPHLPPLIPSNNDNKFQFPIQEKEKEKRRSMTRDIGIQSTPTELSSISSSSQSPSPVPTTPSIEERSIKRDEEDDSPISHEKLTCDTGSIKSESDNDGVVVKIVKKEDKGIFEQTEKGKEGEGEEEEEEERSTVNEEEESVNGKKNTVKKNKCRCKCKKGGCFSWTLWMKKRHREKHKTTTSTTTNKKKNISIFTYHKSGC